MIYIGDGETDVPAMKMVNYQGGYSVAVYPPKEPGRRRTKIEVARQRTAEQLLRDNRAQFVVEADYRCEGPVYRVVKMLLRRIVDEYKLRMNLNAR